MKKKQRITEKQEKFVQLVVAGTTGTQAYMDVFGEKDRHVAGKKAAALKRRAHIKKRFYQVRYKEVKKIRIDRDKLLNELANIALADPRRIFDDDGNLLPPRKWPDEIAMAVASMDVVVKKKSNGELDRHVHKIRFWDKTKALESIAKHLGFYEEDNRQKNPEHTAASIKADVLKKMLEEL